jgi:hypothetical protein
VIEPGAPGDQLHDPATHDRPAPHSGSAPHMQVSLTHRSAVSRHTAPPRAVPYEPQRQRVPMHASPIAHTAVHAPQWNGSSRVGVSQPFAGSPSQSSCEALQLHVPPMQFWFAAQTRPQTPQFCSSVIVSAHVPAAVQQLEQQVVGDAHAPATAVQRRPASIPAGQTPPVQTPVQQRVSMPMPHGDPARAHDPESPAASPPESLGDPESPAPASWPPHDPATHSDGGHSATIPVVETSTRTGPGAGRPTTTHPSANQTHDPSRARPVNA